MTDSTVSIEKTIFNLNMVRAMIFRCRATNNCSMKVVVKEPNHHTHQYFVCSGKRKCDKFTKAISKAISFVANHKPGTDISIEF